MGFTDYSHQFYLLICVILLQSKVGEAVKIFARCSLMFVLLINFSDKKNADLALSQTSVILLRRFNAAYAIERYIF